MPKHMHKAAMKGNAFIIKLEELKAAAREAYDLGLLTAQAPNRHDRVCVYYQECTDKVERFCAVGAYLPIEAAKASPYMGVIAKSHADLWLYEDTMQIAAQQGYAHAMYANENPDSVYSQALRIQQAHDGWVSLACAQEVGLSKDELETRHKYLKEKRFEFLALINHPSVQGGANV